MDAKKLDTRLRGAISWLPDEVMGNILSSLPTKQAASTSVISQKWRYAFRLVNNLDFDDFVGLNEEAAREGSYVFPESFKNFVDPTLALQCNGPIKKFSLKCHVGKDKEGEMACVGRWISNVVERGVSDLDLRVKSGVGLYLPCQLFRSKTLGKLTIGTNISLGDFPLDASLPALKVLFIDSIYFDDEELSDVLLSCCPVLEELSVHQKNVKAPRTISSPTVKRLLVDYDCHGDFYESSYLSFDLPNLLYLEYSDYARGTYEDIYLKALVEAKLDLHENGHFTPNVSNLIFGIRKVEILHLSYYSLDVIYYSCCKNYLCLPVFKNLVKLSLEYSDKRGWKLLAYLIKQSPKLETLVIQDVDSYTENICIPPNHMKVLHILRYQECSDQLKSFLRGFEFLEVLQLDVTKGADDKRRLQVIKEMFLGFVPSKCHIKVT